MSESETDDTHGQDGYRPNVGIILVNRYNQVLWARRASHDGWQFPQGGVRHNESAEQALFRELYEEVGLSRNHVEIVAHTQSWLRYDLPDDYLARLRRRGNHTFRGQKQLWYLLRLIASDSEVCLDTSDKPEFDKWIWLDWWNALEQIVEFKRDVYESAMRELVWHLPRNAFFPRLLP